MYGYIYKITNDINDKIYIGQHRYNKPIIDENYWCSGTIINKAIEKYGLEHFKRELIDIAETADELNEKEKYYISFYDCREPKGYNLTAGGEITDYWTGRKQPRELVERRMKKLLSMERTWGNKISESLKKIEGITKNAQIASAEFRSNASLWTNGEVNMFISNDEQAPEGFVKMSLRKYKKIQRTLEKVSYNDLIDFYKDHSPTDACDNFNITRGELDILLDYYNIEKHSRSEAIKLYNLYHYGVENVMDVPEIKSKHKEAMNKK